MPLNTKRQIYIESDEKQLACEICGKSIKLPNIHSQVCWYAIPGPTGAGMQAYPPTHCSVVQHYACSWEHATLASILCLLTHLQQQDHERQGIERRDDGSFANETLSRIYELVQQFE